VSDDCQMLVRRLQYRLQRQGMLELDTWMTPLLDVLQSDAAPCDKSILEAIDALIQCEAPELLAMQAGIKPIPKALEPWIKS